MAVGTQEHDLRTRALVLGAVPMPPATPQTERDALEVALAAAARFVQEGADLLIVPGGSGTDRVAGALGLLHDRFELPIAVALAGVGAEAAAPLVQAGAAMVVGLDTAGDAAIGAVIDAKTFVVMCIDSGRVHGAGDAGEPLVETAAAAIRRAEAAGVARQRIGLEVTPPASSAEARATALGPADRLVALGCQILVSLAPWDGDPIDAVAAASLAVLRGRRLICTQHVRAVRRACDVVSAVLEADQ